MDKIVRRGIVQILRDHSELLRIAMRQRAKFEGWLKFELAYHLESIGMEAVEVESQRWHSRNRTDISFFR